MSIRLAKIRQELAVHPVLSKLDRAHTESSILDKTIDCKFPEVLEHIVSGYLRKLEWLREELRYMGELAWKERDGLILVPDHEIISQCPKYIRQLIQKHNRVLTKLELCLREQELRAQKLVERDYHHTDYYIDYDNGLDSNTGLSTGQAWKTITKFTVDTVRSAGDRAFLRANITWDQGTEATDINFDEDGTPESPLSLIGCDSVTNDPWSDSSDVKPIIDFEDLAYQFNLSSDTWWVFDNFEIIRCADTNGAIYVSSADNAKFLRLLIHDNENTAVEGIRTTSSGNIYFYQCQFYDIRDNPIVTNATNGIIEECIFDEGVQGGTQMIQVTGGYFEIINCDFGLTTQITGLACVQAENGAIVWMRNTDYDTTYSPPFRVVTGAHIYMEDTEGVFEAQECFQDFGQWERSTSVVRSGGADSSMKMIPKDANTTVNSTVVAGGIGNATGFAQIWRATGSVTITVYARVDAAWTSALTASECYLRARYYSSGSTVERTDVNSTQTIANDGTWTAFSVTINPSREAFVMLWFHLGEFEANRSVYLDIKPVVS